MIPPAADAMSISIFGMQASANGPLAVLALSIMVIEFLVVYRLRRR